MSDSIRLLHITDTHLHASRDARMRGVNTYETFRAIVDRVVAGDRRPDAVLATGDLAQDETRQSYELFCETVGVIDAPIHCMPGNHDSQRIMDEMLNSPPFSYCGTAEYGNWSLIFLNSVVRHDDGGSLSSTELERLDRTLIATADRHVLLAMHHHPMPMNSQWLDGVNLRNSDDLFAVTDSHDHVRAMIWGHVHQASDRLRGKVRMLSTPSTGSQFLPESAVFKLDTRPPGYRWIELLPDGSLETEVIWLK